MDSAKLRSLLSSGTRKRIRKIVPEVNHIDSFYRTACDFFTDDQAELIERFVLHPGFERFMECRVNSSISRFERTLELLMKRVALGIDPEKIAAIAGEMSSETYRRVEKSFFKVPVDRESFELFERRFVDTGEQRGDLLAPYLEFCASAEFSTLRIVYAPQRSLFTDIFNRLVNSLMAHRNLAETLKAASYFNEPHIHRLVFMADDIGSSGELLVNLFEMISRHADPAFFIQMLKTLLKRYPPKNNLSPGKREKEHAFLYGRVASVWNCLLSITDAEAGDFREFLKDFGNPRDAFESFVWDTVFSLEAAKALKAVALFVSTAFSSLRGFYGHSSDTVRFLIRNIIAVISEMEIRNFGGALYRITLKLLMGMKVDRRFIGRRADFFRWMKERTGSVKIEMEVIRFMLFEYIYITLKLVQNTHDMKMTKFCNALHRDFCHHIDTLYGDIRHMRHRAKGDVFGPALDLIRKSLWAPFGAKFSGSTALLEEIISVAETTDTEDDVLAALEKVETEYLENYHSALMAIFREKPERTREAAAGDFWHRVSLDMAMPYAAGVVLPVVGNVPIIDGGLEAKTNGRVIYLPSFINFFKDPLDPLENNRNLTAYVFCALHEAGHILGGSFAFDFSGYAETLERPDLFFRIYNAFEDFRIEAYLVRVGAHPQAAEMVETMNVYFCRRDLELEPGAAVRVLNYLVDEAGGFNAAVRESPEYAAMIDGLYIHTLNTGRFRGMKELLEYGVERLKNIDVANPLGVYPLTREFYEIMKSWSEIDLWGLVNPEFCSKPLHDPSASSCPGVPMTQDDLEELYRQYNENPLSFLTQYGIGVPDDLREEGGDGKGGARIDEFASDILTPPPPDYTADGIIDDSHRTRADDEAAKIQTGELKIKGKHEKSRKRTDAKKKKKSGKDERKKAGKKKFVYSIDPRTRSRTRLSEIREFPVRNIDYGYYKTFRQWEYLAQKVYDSLSVLLPLVKEEDDTSCIEGEMNMDLLIEILSDRERLHSAEFLDLFQERGARWR